MSKYGEWPYEDFKKSPDFNGETIEEFVEKLRQMMNLQKNMVI